MAEQKDPRREVKERMLKILISGLAPTDDPCGYIDNIDDIDADNSYAIDVAIHETVQAVFEDIWGAACIDCRSKVRVQRFKDIKKKWLVPVRKPEPGVPDESCEMSDPVNQEASVFRSGRKSHV